MGKDDFFSVEKSLGDTFTFTIPRKHTTSQQRRCDDVVFAGLHTTSQQRRYIDVVTTLCFCWVGKFLDNLHEISKSIYWGKISKKYLNVSSAANVTQHAKR